MRQGSSTSIICEPPHSVRGAAALCDDDSSQTEGKQPGLFQMFVFCKAVDVEKVYRTVDML